ncbi:MAG: tetratricopeptide repeat protein [Bacteroidaceae bacterium]|nr:tetratricopeptide repeat protein [Bacteroidaceae bacterium]MBQ6693813.1 tetratricopeptide repeat protein [Bacteroidaceae bacterium]
MQKKLTFMLSLAVMIIVSSCSSKMDALKPEYFTVTPQVLEVVGTEIPVTIDGRFPHRFFDKKTVLSITPVLRYDGGEAVAEPVVFQGEKVKGNNRTVSYENGGNFSMRMNFDYVPEMIKSALYLTFTVTKGSKSYTLPDVKVADGCIATSQLYRSTVKSANLAVGEDAFQRVIKQAQQANIMFLIQQTNLRGSEINTQQMKALADSMKAVAADPERRIVDNVEVAAYASPDGGVLLNVDVANGREKNTAQYVKKQMDRAKLDSYLDTDYTAEDWDGFRELVSQSNLPDKEIILRVLSMYNEPEEREAQIKNISTVYSDLADEILPRLRRARITLNYQLIGRSDSEIMEQFASDPKELSLEEILYASVVSEDADEQEKIYKTAARLYPNDYRAYNNLGKLSFDKGDYAAAEEYIRKAVSLAPTAPEVNVNLGYLALCRGNVADAETFMAKGSSAKVGDEALGNLYIAQGQYMRAADCLSAQATNSAALAQLLNKDYSTAKATLESIKTPDAMTHYIKALLGARTNNASLLYDGLKAAVKLDPSLAQKAMADLEFAKYAGNETFKAILD